MRAVAARTLDGPLCRIADLAAGRSRGFDPLGEGRDTMFVVRQGEGVVGYRNACPHYDYARMAWRKDEFLNGDGSRIVCSAHGALFRIADGLCESGPCLGQRLTAVPLEIRDGEVWIVGPYAPGLRRNNPQGGADMVAERPGASRPASPAGERPSPPCGGSGATRAAGS